MSEKSMISSSRFLLYLITVSMFLLILSSMFLLQFSYSSLFPRSVFKLILVNTSTSIENEKIIFPIFSSGSPQFDPKSPTRSKQFSGQLSNKTQKLNSYGKTHPLLRIFMYNLPADFHFALLGWKNENRTWPNVNNLNQIPPYPGGLNLQHSMEYWLTLSLLSSNNPKMAQTCTTIRVYNSSQADVIFVPFFASLSYNRHSKLHGKDQKHSVDNRLQERLVKFLFGSKEWKRFGGKDHVIVAHHPNSMLYARKRLGSAIFVLADFGRYPKEVANLDKDVIAPYKHVVRAIRRHESAPFEERPILVYFKGAIYRKDGGVIRQELYYLLKDEKDVHFAFGSVGGNGVRKASEGMASSKFCLNIAGDTPSSNRLFDSIASHCVPVIISDEIELPYEDVLDYSQFCLFVHSSDAVKKGYLVNLLRGIGKEKWTEMWERLKEVEHHFEYQFPSKTGDAVDMIWQAISRKVSGVSFRLNRENRFKKSRIFLKNN